MTHIGKESRELASILRPRWSATFFLIGLLILLAVGVCVVLLTGLSAASDRVFAVEALVAGMGAIAVIAIRWKRRLVISRRLPIPLFLIWPVLCLYVFIARPFQ